MLSPERGGGGLRNRSFRDPRRVTAQLVGQARQVAWQFNLAGGVERHIDAAWFVLTGHINGARKEIPTRARNPARPRTRPTRAVRAAGAVLRGRDRSVTSRFPEDIRGPSQFLHSAILH